MAVKMTTAAKLIFFEKIFYNKPDALASVQYLLAKGLVFNVAMYAIQATLKDVFNPIYADLPLMVSSNVLMKYVGNGDEANLNVTNEAVIQHIAEWVYALKAQSAPPAIQAPPVHIDAKIGDSWMKLKPGDTVWKNYVDMGAKDIKSVVSVSGATVYPAPVWALQSKDDPIPLANAQVLGQRVNGTDPASIYRVIALGEHGINIAMQIKGYDVSFRLDSKESIPLHFKNRIKKNAFEFKSGGHASLHLSIGDIPVNRVIGAVLFGLDIKLKEFIVNVDEVFAQ